MKRADYECLIRTVRHGIKGGNFPITGIKPNTKKGNIC
jgi:hypothetical protein